MPRLTSYQRETIDRAINNGAYAIDTRHPDQDKDSGLVDMLADLMHWAECYGIDFDDSLRIARDHYDAERRGE